MRDLMASDDWRSPALLGAALASATLAAALVSQYGFGLRPCPLCIIQRWPYVVGVAAAAIALLGVGGRAGRLFGLIVAGAAFEVSIGLGVWHSGVEWGVFEGLASCSAPLGADSLESLLATEPGPNCADRVPFFLWLSMANWNVLASLVIAALFALSAIRALGLFGGRATA